MILFLFYRRSLWFMLPMALTVSFSRVYNGVHYPSDVLAGMVLGAGYAAAGVVALQTIWSWAGRKWFPLWHAQLPSLLKPDDRGRRPENGEPTTESPVTRHPSRDTHWLRLGYVLIIIT